MRCPESLLLSSVLLFLCLLIFNSRIAAQEVGVPFERFGVAEGLEETVISSLLQDQQGYIWFSTQNGLVKYDGYSFTTYRGQSADTAIHSGKFKLMYLTGQMLEAKDGKLWLGGIFSPGGMASFDPKTERFDNILYDPEDSTSLLPYGNCYLLFEDAFGGIWFNNRYFPGNKDVLSRYDPTEKKLYQYPYSVNGKINQWLINSANFAISEQDQSTWVLDEEFFLRRWNPANDSFEIKHGPLIRFPDSLTTDSLRMIFPGSNNWLLLQGTAGIYLWDYQEEAITQFYQHDPTDSRSIAAGTLGYCFEAHDGKVWVKHEDSLVFSVIDPHTQRCTRYQYGQGKLDIPSLPAHMNGATIQVSDSIGLWFQTNSRAQQVAGYLRYDYATEDFQYYDEQFYRSDNQFTPYTQTKAIRDRNHLLWLSTFSSASGFHRQAPRNQQMALYRHQPDDLDGLPTDTITCLFEDSQERMWIGTPKGLLRYLPKQDRFQLMKLGHEDSTFAYITRILEDSRGQIWVGGTAGLRGLFLFDEQRETFNRVNINSQPGLGIYALMEDHQQRLWVSVGGEGVYVLDLRTQQVLTSFLHDREKKYIGALHTDLISVIFQDSKQRIWMGDFQNSQGIYRLKEDESGFVQYGNGDNIPHKINSHPIYFIAEDQEQGLWVATEQGLNQYQEASDRFEVYGSPLDLYNPVAHALSKDGKLWIGTRRGSGLIGIDPSSQTYQSFGKAEGLIYNSNSHSLLAPSLAIDQEGKVWYPTERGLSVFDPATERFQSYFEKDGYQPYARSNISLARKNGEVWIGGPHGLNRIDPQKLARKDSTLPAVYITAIGVLDSTYSAPDGHIFQQTVSFTQHFELEHWQNDLSFEFVALHYLRPEANQYAWKLENYDQNWTQPSLERKASYTNLDPGTYTFRVKASNADGVWNEEGASITIVIAPPWWATWWARSMFLALTLGIVYALYRYQLARRLDQAETQRLLELDSVKTRLYTNITHEFRTPLTVISGMAEQIDEQPQLSQTLIQRNSQHLLRLVNQMLDLSKLESGKLALHLVQGDIISYLQYLTESFHSYAESKGIELIFYPEIDKVVMDYDEEKLMQVISNLLSNAIKFSQEGGKVIFHAQQLVKEGQQSLLLKVVDKGVGIPDEQLPHVFDRFYQIDGSSTRQGEGTGIGLALTKELVQLMGGSIHVESKTGMGSTFLVQIPITQTAPTATVHSGVIPVLPPEIEAMHTVGLHPANEDLPQVLIIEDNPDVVVYLQSCLQNHYQLSVAENGAIGIQKALEQTPDLIISDVMMPEKDGFEVCQALKQDERSSHIPIILLTAKVDIESRLTGLQEGADAYLAKPFEKQELLIRIEQFIQLRHNLQNRYRELHGVPIASDKKYQREDGFVRKVKLIIEEHLSNDEFSVDQLARELGMSRSQLFRKLKALTDQSVVAYLRSYRLARARQLLRNTDLSVSEIAYEVGFKSPSHFSAAFLKEFGEQPSSTRSQSPNKNPE